MTHYSTLVYLSDEVSFANFYKYCFEKFEKVSEVSLISVTDSHQFKAIHHLHNKKLFDCTTFLPAFAFFL